MPRPKGLPTTKTNCRHCGRELSTMRIGTHERVCIHNPVVRVVIIETMAAENAGEGVTWSQYAARSAGNLAIPDVTTLRRATGARDWAGVLAAFGLVPKTETPPQRPRITRTPAQKREAAACEDVATMCEESRRAMAAGYDDAHTFDGYKVHDAPGLSVNGRPCQWVALR